MKHHGRHRDRDDKRSDAEYLADTLYEAIVEGFSNLGDRIAGGNDPENVAMSLKFVSESLDEICVALNNMSENN